MTDTLNDDLRTVAEPPTLPTPVDAPFPGQILLHVDATDVARRIFTVRETIPVATAGRLALLFPEWLPGYHSPQAPIELLAGLVFTAGEETLRWERHPINVHAFFVDVPSGFSTIQASFQFLTPTDPAQGRVVIGAELLMLQWNAVLLYPAGHFASRIDVQATLMLPPEWTHGSALTADTEEGGTVRFAPVPLDVLVDSPVLAGRHVERVPLDATGDVELVVAADSAELIVLTPERLAPHKALVREADHLFGTRHFDRYTMLLALTDDLDRNGVEHHRSCEAISIAEYFRDWDCSFSRRDTLPHEFVHSWNGKHRRGADSWTPSFDQPIRNSLMWVYEGQTQYWDRVLCARSGLWTREQALGALAVTAATHAVRAGSRWRPMSDTTRDPVIAARAPLPWPSWQRSEDYYTEGALVWLDIDTRLRTMTGGERSLDDFARAFFGTGRSGDWSTRTYVFDDVVAELERLAPHDWRGLLRDRLHATHDGAPLDGLERGGYRLTYRDRPSDYWANVGKLSGVTDLTFSLGLKVDGGGRITDVLWEGPAYHAAVTAGSTIESIGDTRFSIAALMAAVDRKRPITIGLRNGRLVRTVTIAYDGGHRFPHLEPIHDGERMLDGILAPQISLRGRPHGS